MSKGIDIENLSLALQENNKYLNAKLNITGQVTQINHWYVIINSYRIIEKICLLSLTHQNGLSSLVNGSCIAQNTPIPKNDNVTFMCMVVSANSLTYSIGSITINKNGEIIYYGSNIEFQGKIIINCWYEIE